MHVPALLNLFTQCDVIKNLAQCHLLRCCNVMSHGINFKFLLRLSMKWKCLLLFLCRYIIKHYYFSNLNLWVGSRLVAAPGTTGSHETKSSVIRCSWRSHSTWSDPSDQVTKVIMCIYRMRILWSFNERFVCFLYGTYSFCPLYICYTNVSRPFFVRYLLSTYALLTTSASTSIATETTSITA